MSVHHVIIMDARSTICELSAIFCDILSSPCTIIIQFNQLVVVTVAEHTLCPKKKPEMHKNFFAEPNFRTFTYPLNGILLTPAPSVAHSPYYKCMHPTEMYNV